MALEQSVLNEESICQILKEYWNINCCSIEKMKLGTANCYKINSGESIYFLKEFQSYISKQDIENENRVLEILFEKGVPSTRYIQTITGEKIISYNEHDIVLEIFIDGETYGYSGFPPEMLNQLAQMLAKIHIALKDEQLPITMDSEWVQEDPLVKYDRLISVLEQHKNDKLYDKIREDLLYKRNILNEHQNDLRLHFENITYGSSHGDYQGCQVIGKNNKIEAVIDFSSAKKLPVVWEIMRSFVQSSRRTKEDAKIDIAGLCNYVRNYCEIAPLSKNDIKAMPYVYVFQLLRSTYGYKEYLQTASEDREELISFAFWRTKMCKEVLENADKIVLRLTNEL